MFRPRALHINGFLVAAPSLLWLGFFFIVPVAFILVVSVSVQQIGRPPFRLDWTLANYLSILGDGHYLRAIVNSLRLAALTTFATLLVGFPMAYLIARVSPKHRNPLLLLVLVPFWTAFLLRIYAWMALLQGNGLINHSLLALGVIDRPMMLLNTDGSMLIGMVYAYLPFMILPLFAVLSKIDWRLLDAASDLGARPAFAFVFVTLPLALPGIVAGSLLVFIPALGEFVVPELLGGQSGIMIGKLIWYEFFNSNDWPRAAALSVTLIALVLMPFLAWRYARARARAGA